MYRPYDDECWIKLAQRIIELTAETYAQQFPKFCYSKAEFDTLDAKSYAPIRRSILKKLFSGPVQVLIDPQTYIDAFEQKRRDEMTSFGIDNLK